MIVAVGVDGELGDDLAGVRVADGDVAVVDEEEHGCAGVGPADAEVAEVAGVADGDFAVLVDFVGAGAPFGAGGAGRCGFRECGVGLVWGSAADGAVWALGVVPGLEFGEQGLQVLGGVGQWVGCEEAFEGLVEAFDLSLGLGVAWAAVLLGDAVGGEELFESAAGALWRARRVVNTRPLSVRVDIGGP